VTAPPPLPLSVPPGVHYAEAAPGSARMDARRKSGAAARAPLLLTVLIIFWRTVQRVRRGFSETLKGSSFIVSAN